MTDINHTAGMDLKLARVAARLGQREVGAAMGVSYSRVSAIEREAFVTPETARRYYDALDTCSTARTSKAS